MDLNQKILYGLERLTDAYKTLIWEKAKITGLSPIQIQILLFINSHKSALSNVSHLAMEFSVTKPTISDAVRVLVNKELLRKELLPEDTRSYNLYITPKGQDVINQVSEYNTPIQAALKDTSNEQLVNLYSSLTDLIFKLNAQGIIKVQRMCFGCRFYTNNNGQHYCNLLNISLTETDIRLDCNEFEEHTS
jgi:DNA-binding MarR family transcriptional regulator